MRLGPVAKKMPETPVDNLAMVYRFRRFDFLENSMEAYAVVETGGKQYRVQKDSVIDVETIAGEAGATVSLDRVLAVSDGSSLNVGAPTVAGATVTAEIVKQFRGDKVIAFRKKKRKGYHKKIGHRQDLTQVKIAAIAG